MKTIENFAEKQREEFYFNKWRRLDACLAEPLSRIGEFQLEMMKETARVFDTKPSVKHSLLIEADLMYCSGGEL